MRVDCIVMAGGRGTRLGGVEKPLLEVCGKPIVLRVLDAASRVCRRILIVYSRHTQRLKSLCSSSLLEGVECVEGGGEGYVEDLRLALALVPPPVLVLPADMPYLAGSLLEDFLAKALASPGAVVNLATSRGLTGVSLFKSPSGPWQDIVYPYTPTLLDIDSPGDLAEAVALCARGIMGVGLHQAS